MIIDDFYVPFIKQDRQKEEQPFLYIEIDDYDYIQIPSDEEPDDLRGVITIDILN